MRFISAWVCGVNSLWAYIAWLDGSTMLMIIALGMVALSIYHSVIHESTARRVEKEAVKVLLESLEDENSNVHKEFMKGIDQGVKDVMDKK